MNKIDGSYHGNYNNKLKQSGDMFKLSAEKAKSVFFEKIPEFSSIKMPDQKNFVKFDSSCGDDLNKIPLINETLRHVVPPEVRRMQEELKKHLQFLIDQQYQNLEKSN